MAPLEKATRKKINKQTLDDRFPFSGSVAPKLTVFPTGFSQKLIASKVDVVVAENVVDFFFWEVLGATIAGCWKVGTVGSIETLK